MMEGIEDKSSRGLKRQVEGEEQDGTKRLKGSSVTSNDFVEMTTDEEDVGALIIDVTLVMERVQAEAGLTVNGDEIFRLLEERHGSTGRVDEVVGVLLGRERTRVIDEAVLLVLNSCPMSNPADIIKRFEELGGAAALASLPSLALINNVIQALRSQQPGDINVLTNAPSPHPSASPSSSPHAGSPGSAIVTPNTSSGVSPGGSSDNESSGYGDDDYQLLVDMFPDCDRMFLRERLNSAMEQDDVYNIDQLVSQLLDTKYPKHVVKASPIQRTMMRERLIKGDLEDIEEYLGVVPDPEKTFMTPTTTTEPSALYKEHCTNQLYNDYRNVSTVSIMDAVRANGHRYAPAWLQLHNATLRDAAKGQKSQNIRFIKNKRQVFAMPADPCEQFYRELQYVKNRDKILKYMDDKQLERALRLSAAQERGELETCSCCCDDEVLFEEMEACVEGHVFCAECVRRSVEVGVGEDRARHKCLNDQCEAEFSMATLRRVLKPATLSLCLRKLMEEDLRLADIENLVSCPFCPFSTIMDNPHDKLFTCLNPECLRQSCRLCKEENHIPLRCNEIEKGGEKDMRAYIETQMSEAMIRECYKCHRRFYKVEGCNKMTCVCGAHMCYVCRQPIKGYDHFNANGVCTTHGDTNALHIEEMKKAADEARRRYLSDHPEASQYVLRYDPLKHINNNNNNNNHQNNNDYNHDYDNDDNEDEWW